MKYVLASLMMFSTLSHADEPLKVIQQLTPVRVDSVSTEIVGNGFPSTHVEVQATFSNSCVVPNQQELVVVPVYSASFSTLNLTLASLPSERVCPMIYRPVTVTLYLGLFTRPNDGLFDQILVNGIAAK